jgi:HEPN domain-containing protein
MPPDLEIVKEWLEMAVEDLDVAGRLLQGDHPRPHSASFHCQQAVEKALKAFLEFRETRPPKTHVLGELLDVAETLDSDFSQLRDAQWLTHFAVGARYPGFEPRPTVDRAQEALCAAGQAVRFVLQRLPSEVQP